MILVGASLALEAWACPRVAGCPLPPLSPDRHHGGRDDDYHVNGGDRDDDRGRGGGGVGNSCFHSLNFLILPTLLFMKQKNILDCKNGQLDEAN